MMRTLLILFIALVVPASAIAQPLFSEPEFQVNTYTTGSQAYPVVAMTAADRFVVVWERDAGLTGDDDVFGRLFDTSGAPVTDQFRLNSTISLAQDTACVAGAVDGGFLAVWESTQPSLDDDVQARRFDSGGSPIGAEFRVNQTVNLSQTQPQIDSDAAGNYVIAWKSEGQDGSGPGVYARRFGPTGSALGGEFRVNTFTIGGQQRPSVSVEPGGEFVIVWDSAIQDGNSLGVFGQRFSATGAPQGTEFRANTFTIGNQDEPVVAHDVSGGFIVAWESFGQDGSANGIYGQRYDASGAPAGTEFRANSFTGLNQDDVSVATDPFGNFMIAWESVNQDGSDPGIYAQRYDAAGAPVGGEFAVNSHIAQSQEDVVLAADGNGSYVAVWQSDFQDGDAGGIFGRPLCPTAFGSPDLGLSCGEQLCAADNTPCDGGRCCGGQCTTRLSCEVIPGDCNASGSLDAGDPICNVLCSIESAPPEFDCVLGADCNCVSGLDAGDTICTVLRQIGLFTPDSCLVGP